MCAQRHEDSVGVSTTFTSFAEETKVMEKNVARLGPRMPHGATTGRSDLRRHVLYGDDVRAWII
jgi:hypothetical protein